MVREFIYLFILKNKIAYKINDVLFVITNRINKKN